LKIFGLLLQQLPADCLLSFSSKEREFLFFLVGQKQKFTYFSAAYLT